uniref:Uncharacterized protein n=1 Tax=Tetraselmis sp. GSL018 TaxID=582737 RepID=A0A061RIW5_9CHLO
MPSVCASAGIQTPSCMRRHFIAAKPLKMQQRPNLVRENKLCLEKATLPMLKILDDNEAATWYSTALQLARQERWEYARRVFSATVQRYPNLCRAWVSWSQMEKKAGAVRDDNGSIVELDFDSCRRILQCGLEVNPTSSCLCQAWGLMELQKGNALAAVKLLDRSAEYDAACKPVQRWKLYVDARNIAFSRKETRRTDADYEITSKVSSLDPEFSRG